MPASSSLSRREARWIALAAQGLDRPRPRARGRAQLLALARRLGAIQLDAINVLERTQLLVPWSRLGAYERADLLELSGPGGAIFEYWGHAASLLPTSHQPLLRWRMARFRDAVHTSRYMARWQEWGAAHAAYVRRVHDEVRERGPLAAAQLSDPRRRAGSWWDRRSAGRQALEYLFARGELAAWRDAGFARLYDLPERVIPSDVLAQPEPSPEEAQRRLVASAAASLGVATLGDLADYYRIERPAAAARVAELVEAREIEPVTVEGWREPAYGSRRTRVARPTRRGGTLLSPFDSLIWERERTRRLFGFDFRIEVYVPAPARRHGYYVLPLLLGDRLVARLDLKADRPARTLQVEAAHFEPGVDRDRVAAAAAAELGALGGWLGLDVTRVGPRGNGAAALRRALREAPGTGLRRRALPRRG